MPVLLRFLFMSLFKFTIAAEAAYGLCIYLLGDITCPFIDMQMSTL